MSTQEDASSIRQAFDVDDNACATAHAEQNTNQGAEVVEDFIRNFCARKGMLMTLRCFEDEWHDLMLSDITLHVSQTCPDAYARNAFLEQEIEQLKGHLKAMQTQLQKEETNARKLRKERDAHRLNHQRIAQEKTTLTEEIKRLKAQGASYEPRISDIQIKFEQQIKENAMLAIERDRLKTQLEAAQSQKRNVTQHEFATKNEKNDHTQQKTKSLSLASKITCASLPLSDLKACRTFQGHDGSVSNLALHPTKPIAVSASDDHCWKMWHLTDGQLLMTGAGHSSWIAGIDFDPQGNGVATASGDGTMKIWDFQKQKCVKTFHENHALWCIKYDQTGKLVATGSLDHVVRIRDLLSEKCKVVMRGHKDSVNAVDWHPSQSLLCTTSSDKSVCLWDTRHGLCTTTFHGHSHNCNHCSFSPDGQTVASSDAKGFTKLWDIRMQCELASFGTTPNLCAANKCTFDRTCKIVAVACSDGCLRFYESGCGELVHSISGHEGGALCILCDASNTSLLSSGSDRVIRLWSSGAPLSRTSELPVEDMSTSTNSLSNNLVGLA